MSLNSLPPKKCYIKRRKYDEQPLPASSNIFETGSPKEIGSSKEISFETKPEVTIQTEAETSFNEESFQKKKLELS